MANEIFKWTVVGLSIVTAALVGFAWIAGRGADNSDSQALATVFYLPALALGALDVLVLVLWGIFRLFSG